MNQEGDEALTLKTKAKGQNPGILCGQSDTQNFFFFFFNVCLFNFCLYFEKGVVLFSLLLMHGAART